MRERESRERALEHRGEDRETVGRLGESLERAGQKKTEEEQSRGRAHRGRAHTDEEQTKSRVQKSGGWCRTLEAWQSVGPKGLSLRGGAWESYSYSLIQRATCGDGCRAHTALRP